MTPAREASVRLDEIAQKLVLADENREERAVLYSDEIRVTLAALLAVRNELEEFHRAKRSKRPIMPRSLSDYRKLITDILLPFSFTP